MSVLFCPCSFGGMDLWYVYPYLYIYIYKGTKYRSAVPRDCWFIAMGISKRFPMHFWKNCLYGSHHQSSPSLNQSGDWRIWTRFSEHCLALGAKECKPCAPSSCRSSRLGGGIPRFLHRRWPNVHPSRWRWWSYVQILICHNCSSCFIMCPRSFKGLYSYIKLYKSLIFCSPCFKFKMVQSWIHSRRKQPRWRQVELRPMRWSCHWVVALNLLVNRLPSGNLTITIENGHL